MEIYTCATYRFLNQPKNFQFPQHSFGVKKPEQRSFSRRGSTAGSGFIMSFVHVGLSTRKFARQNPNNLYILMGILLKRRLLHFVYLFENISL